MDTVPKNPPINYDSYVSSVNIRKIKNYVRNECVPRLFIEPRNAKPEAAEASAPENEPHRCLLSPDRETGKARATLKYRANFVYVVFALYFCINNALYILACAGCGRTN